VSVPVPDPLPGHRFSDLLNEAVPTPALASPEAWQEWLTAHTGGTAWVDGKPEPETNFMARAKPGEVTGGYVKSAATHLGMAVWEKVN
jgi:hypothetical protein